MLAAKHARRTTHERSYEAPAAGSMRALRLLAAVVMLLGARLVVVATTGEDARDYLARQLATQTAAAVSA